MHRVADDRTISLKLSQVLGEIGVNERIIQVRRRDALANESLFNITGIFSNGDAHGGTYNFGSQSEGSTTIGLQSDVDSLGYTRTIHVIQDWTEWEPNPDVLTMLMLRDETSPGYCLLHLLQSDIPLEETHVVSNDFLRDGKGRILFKNTYVNTIRPAVATQQNGPAGTVQDIPGYMDHDLVYALHCKSWPKEGRDWLDRQCIGNWPPQDIKSLAVSKGFFLVPVSSKCNNLDEVEWRISTSMAERLMMFNMNITQIRCYVMMKFVCKTFCTMNGESTITSFMCKCIVFHCIENTCASYWREDNLFVCVMNSLSTLHACVQRLNCPHYLIPTNNLMAHRINPDQQRYLLNVVSSVINFNTEMFFAIQIDALGQRLHMKLTNVLLPHSVSDLPSQDDIEIGSIVELLLNQGAKACFIFNNILRKQKHVGLLQTASFVVQGIQNLQRQYDTFIASDIELEACKHFVPMLCSLVGSLLASFSVYTSKTVSPDAIWWFSAGFDSDVSSSRLKLASAFYCAGDINNAELTLRELEHMYTGCVIPVCGCYPFEREPVPADLIMHLYRNNELLNKSTAFCVKFLRCETSIIPQELRYELFRSTEVEIQNRSVWDSYWMEFAVVDSLPYLYFLQYKIYTHQGRVQQQRNALSNLLKTTLNARYLGHRETAWNLLGQCMEQENMPVEAHWCYQRSLELRLHNNAANFYMARLQRL